MEDMAEFKKVTELLGCVGLEDHVTVAAERAMEFVAQLHRKTWLANMAMEENQILLDQFRYMRITQITCLLFWG